jgi:hypothetical protein
MKLGPEMLISCSSGVGRVSHTNRNEETERGWTLRRSRMWNLVQSAFRSSVLCRLGSRSTTLCPTRRCFNFSARSRITRIGGQDVDTVRHKVGAYQTVAKLAKPDRIQFGSTYDHLTTQELAAGDGEASGPPNKL